MASMRWFGEDRRLVRSQFKNHFIFQKNFKFQLSAHKTSSFFISLSHFSNTDFHNFREVMGKFIKMLGTAYLNIGSLYTEAHTVTTRCTCWIWEDCGVPTCNMWQETVRSTCTTHLHIGFGSADFRHVTRQSVTWVLLKLGRCWVI